MRIGFVGLGAMGSRLARRLLDGGHEVVVSNRSSEPVDRLARAGAQPAATPAQAARGVEAVLTMVADPDALVAVTEGADGVATGIRPPTALVDLSTVGPAAIVRLAEALPAGTPLLDAPVLGSLAEAESGSLRIFVGGDRETFDRLRPLLDLLGSPVHVGALGAGAAAKLVANLTLVETISVLGEALALADGLGFDREAAFEILAATPIAEQAARRRPSLDAADYPPRFRLSLARKDAELVLAAAVAADVDLRLAGAVRSWLLEAERLGLGDLDYSAVLEAIAPRGA
jgi:3-hydroxyisobutyrate dehydrogenase